jgi:DNA-binding transcriptional regulator GbsR (MarR family)
MKTPNVTWFVESMGLSAEADGLPRIAGRLFATLLLSQAPCSLDTLAQTLGVSKASVSTDARRLLERGIVERVSKPGDRRDYYQLAPDFFSRIIRSRLDRWARIHEFVTRMQEREPNAPAAVRRRFDQIRELHELVLGRVQAALGEWERRTASTTAGRAPRDPSRSNAARRAPHTATARHRSTTRG